MKNITIILLLILVSCKNETKLEDLPKTEIEEETNSEINTVNKIDKSVVDMWNDFIKTNPQFKNEELPESWFFHNNELDANRLANLVVAGKKKTSSGLYYMYEEAGADLPVVGTKHIITDFEGKAKAIIQIVKVDTIPFNKITKEYAKLDMGTDIEPLKKWKKSHWDFFSSVFQESEKEPNENMLVVCEWFESIWTNNNNKKQLLSKDYKPGFPAQPHE